MTWQHLLLTRLKQTAAMCNMLSSKAGCVVGPFRAEDKMPRRYRFVICFTCKDNAYSPHIEC